MKFIRKPVVVEAIQFDPEIKPWPEGVQELGGHWSEPDPRKRRFNFSGAGVSVIESGDWVVTNQTGERYVVRQEFFFDVYELVKS